MKGIALGLAGALAAAAPIVAPQIARAQGHSAYGPAPAHASAPRARRRSPRIRVAPGSYGRVYVPRAYAYPPAAFDDRGDPLHRYYTPGFAPNVNNPTVAPSYQAPHVDDGTIYRNEE